MKIGMVIKELRQKKGITQEEFAEALSVSVQSVSRWENGANYPDLFMIPVIATYFNVSADYLLGIERKISMAKLLKTTETFEVSTREEADEMILKFKAEPFPTLKDYRITKEEGKFVLEVTKEFNAELATMKFD